MPRLSLMLTALAFSTTAAQQPARHWSDRDVCYEVFVRSFADANGDGVGDLKGLAARMGYIDSLGATCIWLMPVAESPSYHGYDVSDYYKVEPAYGTADDFRAMVRTAHRHRIKVIVDMVLNHSSSEHPYFKAALRDTASPYRHWYIFSPTDGGKGPWGSPAWHKNPYRDEYYYGIFSAGMPDLDYHNPAVRAEGEKIADYWLKQMGVDGFRLDAVQYLVEDGPCMMDCPGTHAYLREYAAHIQKTAPGAYTVGEVWDPLDTLLTYYPDQLTAYFTFTLSDSLLFAIRRGTVGGMLSGYLRVQQAVPDHRFAPLLRNHDDSRTVTVLGGDAAGARLGATLLLTLPGLPFIYYGEEIGMTGDKPDPRLRTPMQWNGRTGGGFTTGTPWETLQADSATVNVAAEDTAPGSMLNLYRQLIHLRRTHVALSEGRLAPVTTGDSSVVAYLRRATGQTVLVMVNLGSSSRTVAMTGGGLTAGRYAVRTLLGKAGAATVVVGAGEHFASLTIEPRSSLVLELIRQP